jgi:5-oxoprolinase (ATP-hydrolysing)
MGGTSTDVARIAGDFEYVFEHVVGDVEVLAPALAIETVAAGGGSICRIDQGRLLVGPESAGAFPGSACYGAGGPLTLTDVNLLLGRIVSERLPIPIDPEAAERRLQEQADALREQTGEVVEPEELLEGWLRIANERMAEAIRQISLRRGYDPREYALLAFGGAGGQHACAIAEVLDIETVLAPPAAGILSAVGLHHARIERFAERQVLRPLLEVMPELDELLSALGAKALSAVHSEDAGEGEASIERRILELRYVGQDAPLALEYAPGMSVREEFENRYEDLFAHRPEGRIVELVSARVVARGIGIARREAPDVPRRSESESLAKRVWSRGAWVQVEAHERNTMQVGQVVEGPAMIVEDHALLFVESGWTADVHASGCIVATRLERSAEAVDESAPAAVTLELFRHRFESIAREMGELLRRTSISTNIKERLDFSCALLDAEGRLVVNAPHIPVHLGALGLCVRTLREAIEIGEGDVVLTNHPAFGGSHLPDLTVVAAAHDDEGERIGYVAVRAHHAEIGGRTPGSMPPDATTLAEEGVVLPPTTVVRSGEAEWTRVQELLTSGDYPTRALSDNLADLAAMVAAARAGVRRLQELSAGSGSGIVHDQMDALRALAWRHVEDALRGLREVQREAHEQLDDGSPIRVRVEVDRGQARIDFGGSAPVHPGNMNATDAIVRSAALYALRLLVREPLPLNEGLMEAVEIVLDHGMLNPRFESDPASCPAIVGGNVETSQRVVDALLAAFGLVAASQGTMNNVTFGNERFGYYETIGGGTGAGEGFDGASGVHSHMTNTRLTDAEVLEHRYPVLVRRLQLRQGSGGEGRWRGGDGILRELEFLESVTLSVMTQRRAMGPPGMAGGEPGAPGTQRVIRGDGTTEVLSALDRTELNAGDRFVIETPGGGGFGRSEGGEAE